MENSAHNSFFKLNRRSTYWQTTSHDRPKLIRILSQAPPKFSSERHRLNQRLVSTKAGSFMKCTKKLSWTILNLAWESFKSFETLKANEYIQLDFPCKKDKEMRQVKLTMSRSGLATQPSPHFLKLRTPTSTSASRYSSLDTLRKKNPKRKIPRLFHS